MVVVVGVHRHEKWEVDLVPFIKRPLPRVIPWRGNFSERDPNQAQLELIVFHMSLVAQGFSYIRLPL